LYALIGMEQEKLERKGCRRKKNKKVHFQSRNRVRAEGTWLSGKIDQTIHFSMDVAATLNARIRNHIWIDIFKIHNNATRQFNS
jgi:hypothetical protein